jgi:hypothetical protein
MVTLPLWEHDILILFKLNSFLVMGMKYTSSVEKSNPRFFFTKMSDNEPVLNNIILLLQYASVFINVCLNFVEKGGHYYP